MKNNSKQDALTEFRINLAKLNDSIEKLALHGVNVDFPTIYKERLGAFTPVRVLTAEIIDPNGD